MAFRVQNVIADLDHYYLLGFEPSESSSEASKGLHSLEIKVSRSDAIVRHRKGYLPSAQPAKGSVQAAKSNVESLLRVGMGLLPNAEIPLRVFAAPVARVGRDVAVIVAVETNSKTEDQAGKGLMAPQCGAITYLLMAVDLKKKRVAKSISRSVPAGVFPGTLQTSRARLLTR
jgi:hypothetical protein